MCQYLVLFIPLPCSLTNLIQYAMLFLKLFISEISHPALKGSLGISVFSKLASHTLFSEDFTSAWLTEFLGSDFFLFLPARNFKLTVDQSCTAFSRSSSCLSASANALVASSFVFTATGN